MVSTGERGLFAGGLDFSKLPATSNTLGMHLPVIFGALQRGRSSRLERHSRLGRRLKPLLDA